ncbi:hypothetical protein CANARDRAFT_27701 [[Candida] arabinofermentans NRRL YB-2248]|uniref:P-type Cu(+) transporter n=1 Tax=[Candida] arabinofermentans NRRL YB-2248 TaxID=983967 RepID=A0A1E4T452_9ASCO|nr:hypothetical protein CANARDRAFT_27701 [[Candida] arabinofermentans NRRL YB-2248]
MSVYSTSINVGGMTCSACTDSITKSLSELPGVINVTVSLITEEAVIQHTDEIKPEQFSETIEDTGFESSNLKTTTISKTNKINNDDDRLIGMKKYKSSLSIGGMTCSSCVNSITNMIKNIQGVDTIEVSLITEDAIVVHDGTVTPNQLIEVIEDCGFDAILNSSNLIDHNDNDNDSESIETITLQINGMTCANCSNSIEDVVNQLDGVISCNVALSTEEAKITFDQNKIGIRTILNSIDDCGFEAILNTKLDNTSQLELLSKIKDVQYWRSLFLKLLMFGAPVFFLGHILPAIKSLCHIQMLDVELMHGIYLTILIQFLLSSYIQLVLAQRFYINSYKAIKHRSGTMDLLICISTSIVYLYSCISMIGCVLSDEEYIPNVLFDTSVMLLIFVTLGKWVESKAKGNTSTALSKLLSLTPSSCTIIENPEAFDNLSIETDTLNMSNLIQKQIGIQLLQKNDVVLILPGSKIPTDGLCIFGNSEVDESLLTGESMPVIKRKGSKLIGGTVNTASPLYMKVDKLGENTQLQQIVKLVKDAQVKKAPVQRFADAIASKFVIIILLLSLITLAFWSMYILSCDPAKVPKFFMDKVTHEFLMSKVLQVSISVIVVACPCALGLAAPTAVMVGTGVGASNGILIKGGDVLEKANAIDCIVFDKTGTITSGKMKINRYEFLNGFDSLKMWSILHAMESNSEHPVAQAIVRAADDFIVAHTNNTDKKPIEVEIQELDVHVGSGITARVRDAANGSINVVRVGTLQLIEESKMSNYDQFIECVSNLEQDSYISTIAHIIFDDVYVGFIELSDSLKSDSKLTIQALSNLGYSVAMVTGDNSKTAKHVGKLIGMPEGNIFAEAKPGDKLDVVKLLQNNGLNVAFVGDGINDAPALVQADLGIAIATGTDIAIDAADIVLLSSYNELDNATQTTTMNGTAFDNDDNNKGKSGMSGVLAALDISKKSFKSIKLNFALAVIYNLVMLPIAMGLLIIPFGIMMHPIFASAAMACSSISVILNSLRLKRWKIPDLRKIVSKNHDGKIASFDLDLESTGTTSRDVTMFNLSNFQIAHKIKKEKWNFLKSIKNKIQRQSSGSYEMISRS